MAQDPEIRRVLCRHLHDPASSFSIGSLGAIAEFHRDAAEPLVLDDPAQMAIATVRGALRIDLADGVTPLAYETLSRRPERWQHGVLLCLPRGRAASGLRSRLTELGPDPGAVRAEDRAAVLFDLGLAARNVDFCVRTEAPALLAILRRSAGRSLFEPGNPALAALREASPHRIVLSRLGRVEVFQPIGRDSTPEGPHTHLLPKLLASGRTHAAGIPVPRDQLPCLSLYPANPLFDGLGRTTAFDRERLAAFQGLLERWGLSAYRAEKARLAAALAVGLEPGDYAPPDTRLGRTALRVALRQARQLDGDGSLVPRWLRCFDARGGREHQPQ